MPNNSNDANNLYLTLTNEGALYPKLCDIAQINGSDELKVGIYEEVIRDFIHDPANSYTFRNGVAAKTITAVAGELNGHYSNHAKESIAAGHPLPKPTIDIPEQLRDQDVGKQTHYYKYEVIARQLGIDNVASLVPVGAKQIKEALAKGDEYFNDSIPIRHWDIQHFNMTNLAKAAKLPAWSESKSVSTLKHVAKHHQDRLLIKDQLYLGKCDGYGNGRKSCEAYLEWTYDPHKGKFSMSADVWNARKTDTLMGGQCVDEVVKMFPKSAKTARMVEIWKAYHLNDMKAGSPAQEAYLKEHKADWEAYKKSDDYKQHGERAPEYFSWAKRELEAAGLQPDPNHEHNGKPYSYGSTWLKEELPKEIVQEILSWSEPAPEKAAAAAKNVNAVAASIVGTKGMAALKASAESGQDHDQEIEAE